ncbi:MAG: hypothetical protein JWM27_4978 [Gemmatimonadetes bacterium]|nr:hypothetical protein [Gemmatimonadota bacterium]
MNARTFALALALSGAALPAVAQQTTPAPDAPHARHQHARRGEHGAHHGDPVARLIARRDSLGLSADQVSRLQAVQQRYQSQSQPLAARLRALRPDSARRGTVTAEQRQALRTQAQPIAKQLREQRQAERRETQSILTDAQKQKVASHMREHRHARGGRVGMRGQRAGQRGGMRGARGGMQSPAARLVARREQLGLSADQVSRLQAVDQQLTQKNQPLADRLRAFRPDSATRQRMRGGQASEQERAAMRTRMEQARPLMQQLRENRRAAMQQARAVLTADQQTRLRDQARAGRRHRGERARRSSGAQAPTT